MIEKLAALAHRDLPPLNTFFDCITPWGLRIRVLRIAKDGETHEVSSLGNRYPDGLQRGNLVISLWIFYYMICNCGLKMISVFI